MSVFRITWDLTSRCNKACRHCYVDCADLAEFSLEELHVVFKRICGFLEKWGLKGNLAFTGGEVLLRKEELFSLMEAADRSPQINYYQILTNGTLLLEDDINWLKKRRKLGLIQLSLEGGSVAVHDFFRGEGSLAETWQRIRMIKRAGFKVAITYTISRDNYSEIPLFIKNADAYRVDEISFDRLIPVGGGRELKMLGSEELKTVYEEIYRLAKNTEYVNLIMRRPLFCLIQNGDKQIGATCAVGLNSLSIMSDGTLYPCRWLPVDIGNIMENDLTKIWQQSPVLIAIRGQVSLKGKCNDCNYIKHCGGCRGLAYSYSGDCLGEDPLCWL